MSYRISFESPNRSDYVSSLLNVSGVQRDAVAFENAVQAWLEELSGTSLRGRVKDPKLLEIINHYILPAVETGVVRAAGPR
jgi:hypothetical protein